MNKGVEKLKERLKYLKSLPKSVEKNIRLNEVSLAILSFEIKN